MVLVVLTCLGSGEELKKRKKHVTCLNLFKRNNVTLVHNLLKVHMRILSEVCLQFN